MTASLRDPARLGRSPPAGVSDGPATSAAQAATISESDLSVISGDHLPWEGARDVPQPQVSPDCSAAPHPPWPPGENPRTCGILRCIGRSDPAGCEAMLDLVAGTRLAQRQVMHPFPHHYAVHAHATPEDDVMLRTPGVAPLRTTTPVEFGGAGELW